MEKYIVRLTAQEREELTQLVSKGKTSARKIKHANILLKADADGPAWLDEEIATSFSIHTNTVHNIRERFVWDGLETALNHKKSLIPSRDKILDGQKEARLIALACTKPPAGCGRWTLRLIADKLVELNIVETISHETVRQALKKTS